MNDIPEPDRLAEAPHPRETAVLFGQEAAEAAFLAAARDGRVPHGWMITGPRGVGKATLAWRIARYMLAGGRGDSLAMDLGNPVFRQVAALAAPGLWLCRRPWDEKGKRLRTQITIDEARGLKAFFQMSAAEGGWRVAIVDAADELNPSAANAILKILEEPPARALLLLVCHQPARLLPTIRSRCRVLRCAPLGPDDLARATAAAGYPVEEEAGALAALAGGSAGEAVRLIAEDGLAVWDEVAGLIASAPGMNRPRLIALAESCAGREAEERYATLLRLTQVALGRMAQAAAGAAVTPAGAVEARLLARVAGDAGRARAWAELAAQLSARAGHARAVNLDPAQVILDTFLQIDAAAAEALGSAA
jgi:DNA polymerase-3 subunit delta'